ncbi:MAG: acyl-CoA desaturase [Bacteroidota bacterium]|nr:acyl-CoA desaturase [Bacteroidota bacterium]
MTAILIFFFAHWYLSLFSQTFFLHRYAAHKMFTMNPFWEKFFFLFQFVTQGASYLSPRAYSILHRMHHAYSDTEKDPHSPHHSKNVFEMMWKTKNVYQEYLEHKRAPEERFILDVPHWENLEKIGESWFFRIFFGTLYVLFYINFVPAGMWYLYLLLPIHFLMGPIHGAIVNWSGHVHGYQNFNANDKSRNTLMWDFLCLGELFQNNHHMYPRKANLALKWFEFDPTYQMIRIFNALGIVKIKPQTVAVEYGVGTF